jgi:hypothetical protein
MNSTHTARQAKSSDIDENMNTEVYQWKCKIHVLICVKSKHGWSYGSMTQTKEQAKRYFMVIMYLIIK